MKDGVESHEESIQSSGVGHDGHGGPGQQRDSGSPRPECLDHIGRGPPRRSLTSPRSRIPNAEDADLRVQPCGPERLTPDKMT